MSTHISSIATANPPYRYNQSEIWKCFQHLFQQEEKANLIFEKSRIDSRYFSVPPFQLKDYCLGQWGTRKRNEVYKETAPVIGEKAARLCLEQAHISPDKIDHIIAVTCTGCVTPGLDIQIAQRLGLRPNIRRTHIGGMGCYAAFPALQAALTSLDSKQSHHVLLVAVELCSLHLQPEADMDNIVSTSLFADGAAAVLLTSEKKNMEILRTATHTSYDTQKEMTWEVGDHGFQMRLSSYVPRLIGSNIRQFVSRVLEESHLTLSDIKHWAVHPGGPRILQEVAEQLYLSEQQMKASWQVLREFGNMSAPTVLFVLNEVIQQEKPRCGEYGMMLGFGPGLTFEACLIRWQ